MMRDRNKGQEEDGQDIGEAILWAEAKLGELLKRTVKPRGEKLKGSSTKRTTLPSLPPGITKKESHEAQTLAKHPE
jgi:hypothetical protein